MAAREVGRAAAAFDFAHAESAIPTRISPAENAIMIFGSLNSNMKTANSANCRSAAIQIFPLRGEGVTNLAAHAGHTAAEGSVRSRPHIGHCRVDVIAPRLQHGSARPTIDEGNG